MSDLVTVSQKLEDALEAVNALRDRLIQLVVNTEGEKPQPEKENNTVSQPDPDATQKVPVVTPQPSEGTYIEKPQGPLITGGGNFSA